MEDGLRTYLLDRRILLGYVEAQVLVVEPDQQRHVFDVVCRANGLRISASDDTLERLDRDYADQPFGLRVRDAALARLPPDFTFGAEYRTSN